MAHVIATIYSEEFRAPMCGRFAWPGAAVVMLALGVLATVGTQARMGYSNNNRTVEFNKRAW